MGVMKLQGVIKYLDTSTEAFTKPITVGTATTKTLTMKPAEFNQILAVSGLIVWTYKVGTAVKTAVASKTATQIVMNEIDGLNVYTYVMSVSSTNVIVTGNVYKGAAAS